MQYRRFLLPLAASTALAQTYTSCNPTTNTTCSPDAGLTQSTYSVDFTQGASDDWTMTYGNATYNSSGACFTITESGDAPTMQFSSYIFFGVVSIFMRAAPGTGIVSSAILESDDLDEIDWEWLGGDLNEVETNYFGKGNTTTYDRATYVDVTDTQGTTHNYTIEWTSAYTTWWIDGNAVRTLKYEDAVDGKNYPQTPMRIKLGNWAGGDPSEPEGTIEWAGGETDYTKGPFTMMVEKIEITNYNPGSSYTYGDMTGDYTSIEVSNSTSGSSTTETSSNNGTDTSSASASAATSSASSSSVASSSSAAAVSTAHSNSTTTATTATGTATKATSASSTSSTASSTSVINVNAAGSSLASVSTAAFAVFVAAAVLL